MNKEWIASKKNDLEELMVVYERQARKAESLRDESKNLIALVEGNPERYPYVDVTQKHREYVRSVEKLEMIGLQIEELKLSILNG